MEAAKFTIADTAAPRLALTQREFCTAIGIGLTTLHRLRRAGRLHVIVLGGRTLITVAEAERFLREEIEPQVRRGANARSIHKRRKSRGR